MHARPSIAILTCLLAVVLIVLLAQIWADVGFKRSEGTDPVVAAQRASASETALTPRSTPPDRLRLIAGVMVRLVVRDSDGRLLGNAVAGEVVPGDWFPTRLCHADEDGVIRIHPTEKQLVVSCKGYQSSIVEVHPSLNEHEVILSPAMRVRFFCEDMNGKPLRGVRVSISTTAMESDPALLGDTASPIGPVNGVVAQALSNENGVAEIDGLERRRYLLDIWHSHLVPDSRFGRAPNNILDASVAEHHLRFSSVHALCVDVVGDDVLFVEVRQDKARSGSEDCVRRILWKELHRRQGNQFILGSAALVGESLEQTLKIACKHKGFLERAFVLRPYDNSRIETETWDVSAIPDATPAFSGALNLEIVGPGGEPIPLDSVSLGTRMQTGEGQRTYVAPRVVIQPGTQVILPSGTYWIHHNHKLLKHVLDTSHPVEVGSGDSATHRVRCTLVPVHLELNIVTASGLPVPATVRISSREASLTGGVRRNGTLSVWAPAGRYSVTVHTDRGVAEHSIDVSPSPPGSVCKLDLVAPK